MVVLMLLGGLALGAEEPPPEEAPPWSVSVTDRFELRYRVRPERLPAFPDRPVFNYVEQVNRLNLAVSRGRWSFLLQLDQVMLAANRYVLDGVLHDERQLLSPEVPSFLPGQSYVNPEKVQLRWSGRRVTWRLGDSYASFGTGIALNLARNVDIDVDTSVQGVSFQYREGAWDVTALVGQLNRQQVFMDHPNVDLRGDRRHAVGGLRVVRYGLGPATVGVHGVVYDFVDAPGWGPGFEALGTLPDAVVTGATVEAAGLLDTLVEGNLFLYPTSVAFGGAEPSPGHALYASTVAYVGPTIWQLEGKRYRNSARLDAPVAPELYQVAVGPTLEYERVVTEDSAATLGSNDIWGTRLRSDWVVAPGVTPYAAVGLFHDRDTGPLHFNDVPETIAHGVVGAEVLTEDLSLFVNGGARHDQRVGRPGDADRMVHADADVKVPLVGGLHGEVSFAALRFWWGDNPLQQADYTEVESAVSVLHGSRWALTWFTDFSTNPLIDSKGNLTDGLYGAVQVQVKPSSAVTLRGFYGAYKAGIRCSGGQCRQLPGFEGVRFSAEGTF